MQKKQRGNGKSKHFPRSVANVKNSSNRMGKAELGRTSRFSVVLVTAEFLGGVSITTML